MAAHQAHNLEVDGSSPSSAILFDYTELVCPPEIFLHKAVSLTYILLGEASLCRLLCWDEAGGAGANLPVYTKVAARIGSAGSAPAFVFMYGVIKC